MEKQIRIGAQVSGQTCVGEPFSGTITEIRGPFSVVLDDTHVTPISLVTSIDGQALMPHDIAGAVQRRANARLMASKPQQACDSGLFSDEANQLDLIEVTRQK